MIDDTSLLLNKLVFFMLCVLVATMFVNPRSKIWLVMLSQSARSCVLWQLESSPEA